MKQVESILQGDTDTVKATERERESLFFPYTLVIQLFFKYGNERKFINKGGFFDKNRLEMFDSNYGSPIMVV